MASNSELQVTTRRATHGDCQYIKAINRNLYGGHDYFLHSFHSIAEKPNYFPFVAEVAGNIVGYACGQVIDDGEAIVLEAARVSLPHQGKQVINQVHQSMLIAALIKFPTLKKIIWISADASISNQSMGKHSFIEMIDVQSTVMFDASSARLKALCESKDFQEEEEQYNVKAVCPVPKREALQLLTEEIHFLDFAPETLTVAWQPCQWFQSNLAEQLEKSNLKISRCQKTGKIVAFSFDTMATVDLGPRGYFDVYCELESNSDLVMAHVLYHIRELSVLHCNGHIYCSCHFPEKIDRQRIKSCLENLGLTAQGYQEEQSIVFAANLADFLGLKNKL